ncbi:unnamed protein product [Leptidea sinapis]|nr:unnamed protein product [Leptidea sinapis]
MVDYHARSSQANEQLMYLSKIADFTVQFSDFPKGTKPARNGREQCDHKRSIGVIASELLLKPNVFFT